MKRICTVLWLVVLAAGCSMPAPSGSPVAGAPAVEVFFSPRGGCTEAVVEALGAARTSVLVQAYSFTSAPIAEALVKAHRRGVQVQVILDKSQRSEKYSSATFLVNAGVPTVIDAKHSISHNKVMIIDSETVITGSFNFTKAAEESNAENLLVIKDASLAARYMTNWREHQKHAEKYEGREKS
jgi:phosphatidylserine/phosphatidylglycerophosphate/cardiolipin synthase-like enzyme